jgi:hypothetical protein
MIMMVSMTSSNHSKRLPFWSRKFDCVPRRGLTTLAKIVDQVHRESPTAIRLFYCSSADLPEHQVLDVSASLG